LLKILCGLLLLPFALRGEQLPVKSYSIADGLAHDEINYIVQDSRGFLWFCTNDGLSRFDGYRFTTYGLKEGLPVANISYLFESRSGAYWVATQGGGVSRFNPTRNASADLNTQKLFDSYRVGDTELSNFVNVIFEDSAGRIWVGSDGGLFLLHETADGAVSFEHVKLGPFDAVPPRETEIKDMVEDAEGALCFATYYGLVRRFPDGRQIHYTIWTSQPTDVVWALILDDKKRLWIGHQAGLLVFHPEPASSLTTNEVNLGRAANDSKKSAPVQAGGHLPLPDAPGKVVWITTAEGLAHNNIQALHQSADGRVWVGTRGGGLSVFDGDRISNYAVQQGLNNRINAVGHDRAGNVWLGTQASGAIKITGNGLVSYREADGLGNPEIISISETNAGQLCAISSKWTVNRFDGERFTAIRPNLPKQVLDSSSGRWVMIEDHENGWWVATGVGLYRFPPVARLEDLARVTPKLYTTRDGLADDNISRLFEDSRGDVWISSYNPPVMLVRWERSTNTFHKYTEKEGHPTGN
jgi:streptogramin lyase